MTVKTEPGAGRPGASTAERVAAAAATVLARDGFDVLSVRTVAREAGLSGGAVQYHYATRVQLLLAAYAHTVRSITERLLGADLGGPLPEVLGRMGREMLPLDPQRHRECVVWVTLGSAASAHPELAVVHAEALRDLTVILHGAISVAVDGGQVRPDVDPATAADLLVAVVDGLTLQGITGSRAPARLAAALDAAVALLLPAASTRSDG